MAALSLKASHMKPFDRTSFARAFLKASLLLLSPPLPAATPPAASAAVASAAATSDRARFAGLGMLCDTNGNKRRTDSRGGG